MGIDECLDRRFELRDAANVPRRISHRELGEPALDEAEPRAVDRGEGHVQAGRLANQCRISAALCVLQLSMMM